MDLQEKLQHVLGCTLSMSLESTEKEPRHWMANNLPAEKVLGWPCLNSPSCCEAALYVVDPHGLSTDYELESTLFAFTSDNQTGDENTGCAQNITDVSALGLRR